MIMKNRITAPNPQVIASRKDSEKTFICLRAIVRLHRNDLQFFSRRTHANDVGRTQNRFAADMRFSLTKVPKRLLSVRRNSPSRRTTSQWARDTAWC